MLKNGNTETSTAVQVQVICDPKLYTISALVSRYIAEYDGENLRILKTRPFATTRRRGIRWDGERWCTDTENKHVHDLIDLLYRAMQECHAGRDGGLKRLGAGVTMPGDGLYEKSYALLSKLLAANKDQVEGSTVPPQPLVLPPMPTPRPDAKRTTARLVPDGELFLAYA